MSVTKDQAQHLAALAVACRPHGARHWDPPGVVAAIGKVASLNLADVACAVFRAAADRTLDTPAAIGNTSSSAWRERVAEVARPSPPKSGTACWTCGRALTTAPPCCDAPARRPERGNRPPAEYQAARGRRTEGETA